MDINGVNRCLSCMEDKGPAPLCPHCGRDEAAPEGHPLCLPAGELLNDQYMVGRMLGHGGFGITYLAWDLRLNVRVAVKEYMPRDQVTRARDGRSVAPFQGDAAEQFAYGLGKFLDEARNLARFGEHPGIVKVLGYFEAHGTAYMVMQYVDGLDLKAYLAQVGGRLPPPAALGIMAAVLDALRAVHDSGLLHRDLSPDNVYITRSSRIMILDFGAARDALGSHSRSLAMVHKEGYSPEEQYRVSGQQGPWTDIYAAAATLYRMLTGSAPPDAMERLAEDTLVPPSRLGVALEHSQEAALMKALAVRAADRFQDARAFQVALLPRVPGRSSAPAEPTTRAVQVPPATTPKARVNGGKRWAVPVLTVLVAVLAAGLAWSLSRQQAAPPDSVHVPADYSPPAEADNAPGALELLVQAELERQAEVQRRRRAEAEQRQEAELERQRQAEMERERRRQAAVDGAASAAAAVVRSYYRHVDDGNASAAMDLWYRINSPANLRSLINGTRSAQVLRVDRIRLDPSLTMAEVPVLVRVMGSNGRSECWSGPIAMLNDLGVWKIETMKALGKAACP